MKTQTKAPDVVTVNVDQRLYVIPSYGGYTSLGFDYAYQTAVKVAAWASLPAPSPANIGTIRGYNEYSAIMADAGEFANRTKARCPALLCPQLVGHEGSKVKVVDAYGEIRKFWVGKSMGWLPIHLELKTLHASGGGGVTGTPFKSLTTIKETR